MHELRNHLNRAEGLVKLAKETVPRKTLSFYRYVEIKDPVQLRHALFQSWDHLGVLGRVYLAHEGINAQISIPETLVSALQTHLATITEFSGIPMKFAIEEPDISFWKLTIKVRKQIVADNLPAGTYDISNVGNHLNAKAWNEAMASGAIVVDMRNRYESTIGKFHNAITPVAQTFHEELPEVLETLADKKDQKILLYCTGGIRCEKASAYLKHHGFEDVNQLHGGIIQYKHDIEREGLENTFRGKNYVFDGRMAETISDEILGTCYTCKSPADTYVNCMSDLCHAHFIQCAPCQTRTLGTCSLACQDIAALPADERVRIRKNRKATFAILPS
jgi:UPF0176 protein